MYMDMNCQQTCEISRKKDLTEVKIFLKVLGGRVTFLKHSVLTDAWLLLVCMYLNDCVLYR